MKYDVEEMKSDLDLFARDEGFESYEDMKNDEKKREELEYRRSTCNHIFSKHTTAQIMAGSEIMHFVECEKCGKHK